MKGIAFMQPLLAAAGGSEGIQKMVASYRGMVFPEHKFDDAMYIKKSREIFKKLENVNFYITGVGK